MPNTFTGLNMASNALRSFQRALDTSGHNIANVNTPGYSRQTVTFGPTPSAAFYSGGGMMALGTGVTIMSLSRIRDQFLDVRARSNQSDTGRLDTLQNALGEVQSLYQDAAGGGISDALSGFFSAWSNLAADPTQSANRLKVQQAAQSLADQVRGNYTNLSMIKQQQGQLINNTLGQIQSLAGRIAELNKSIREQQASGAAPNDLLDQRDQTLQQLSQLTDVSANTYADGTLVVSVGGFGLVDAQGANTMPKGSFDPNTQTVTDGTHTVKITGGQLAGAMQSIVSIDGYMSKLDTLANTLRTQINTLHASGTNAAGNTGVLFFNDANPQTGAANFDLDSAVKTDPNAIVTSSTGASGDGGIALALSQIADTKIAGLGNRTPGNYYADLITGIGSDVASTQTSLETQQAVGQQIQNQIQTVSGVSLDDEMANMLQFQRSYQAAAKVLSIFDQATQDVINMIHP